MPILMPARLAGGNVAIWEMPLAILSNWRLRWQLRRDSV